MTRHLAGTLIVLMIASAGCATRSAGPQDAVAEGYRLLFPPDVPDPRYPGGSHVRADAPLGRWHQVAVFATLEECESSRVQRIDESIDHARAEVGEQAKFQLPVRRAVNARCVPAGAPQLGPPRGATLALRRDPGR